MVFSLKKFYDIRVDNDLSQKEMSKILDISEDAYSNYENGTDSSIGQSTYNLLLNEL